MKTQPLISIFPSLPSSSDPMSLNQTCGSLSSLHQSSGGPGRTLVPHVYPGGFSLRIILYSDFESKYDVFQSIIYALWAMNMVVNSKNKS